MSATIIGRHVGHTATRFLMSDRGYVVATDDGRLICITRACMEQRISDRCEHVALVKALDPAEFDTIPEAGW